MISDQKKQILENASLQSFFMGHFVEINKLASTPIPNEILFYASKVMDKYHLSSEFFEDSEGKIRDKILGMKLLKTEQMHKKAQQRVLQEIGDTSLLLVGYFSNSINRKIVDHSYYRDLGRLAYSRLDTYMPNVYDVANFFQVLAHRFADLATILNVVSQKLSAQEHNDVSFIVGNSHKYTKVS